jgi:hypothetical protein
LFGDIRQVRTAVPDVDGDQACVAGRRRRERGSEQTFEDRAKCGGRCLKVNGSGRRDDFDELVVGVDPTRLLGHGPSVGQGGDVEQSAGLGESMDA